MNRHSELISDTLRNIKPIELGLEKLRQAAVELLNCSVEYCLQTFIASCNKLQRELQQVAPRQLSQTDEIETTQDKFDSHRLRIMCLLQ